MPETICTNCETTFESDDDLEIINDKGEFIKACPKCKTDAYLKSLNGE